MEPKYDITVQLSGEDGNAFNLMGIVNRALRNADAPQKDIDAFIKEATAADYNHLLRTCMKWVHVN